MFRRPQFVSLIMLLLVTLASVPSLLAQSTTASMLGVVRDASGAVVPGARVTVTNTGTSFTRTMTTDNEGSYLFNDLPIGSYELKATMSGFETFVQTGITLVVNQNARVDVALALGSASQTLQVNAQVTDVDTVSSEMGELVDSTRIQQLPLNGRNTMQL